MTYLPDFSKEDSVFIEGLMRTNAAHSTRVKRKPSKSGLEQRLIPLNQREKIVSRDTVYITEDDDLVEWELQVRAYLGKLAKGRKHSVAAPLIWEWATGRSVAEEHAAGNRTAYTKDLRRINTILRSYFHKPYATYINGRKFPRAYRVSKHFIVTRKAPHCVSLNLQWKDGVKF